MDLDNFYKWVKILGIIVAVSTVAITAATGIAVGHARIEELQNAQETLQANQVQAGVERTELRREISNLDRSLIQIQTDVRWIRDSLEKRP